VFAITEVTGRFPDFRVALVVATELDLSGASPADCDDLLAAAEGVAAGRLGTTPLSAMPELACWRAAYKAFGVKKTSYRSSVERLLKTVQRGERLARVNALVDIYNAVSLRHRMPVGADDLDRVTPPLAFRFARGDESFVPLGRADPEPPAPGEVVYADAEKCLCRRWNWYQDGRSAIRPTTRRAVLTIQALAPTAAALTEAAAELSGLIARHCRARCAVVIADCDLPVVPLPTP